MFKHSISMFWKIEPKKERKVHDYKENKEYQRMNVFLNKGEKNSALESVEYSQANTLGKQGLFGGEEGVKSPDNKNKYNNLPCNNLVSDIPNQISAAKEPRALHIEEDHIVVNEKGSAGRTKGMMVAPPITALEEDVTQQEEVLANWRESRNVFCKDETGVRIKVIHPSPYKKKMHVFYSIRHY